MDRLLQGLAARGYDVRLLAGGPTAAHPYPVRSSGGTYSQYLRAPFVYLRHLRGTDIVVDAEAGIPYFSPLWRRGPMVCLVYHVHGPQWRLYFPRVVAAFGNWLESRVMPRVYRHHQFVAISASTADELVALGIPRDQIEIVEMGIDPVENRLPRSETPLFVALGALVPHKRVELLLDMWERVRPHTGGRLVIIGDGPERAALERRAGPGVEFAGRVSDDEKDDLLDQAWLLCHSALHEGWGMVVMEAAARGTPSIGFDVVGVRDSIVDGRSGALAATVDDFVAAWIGIAGDPERRARLGAGARAWADEHSWDAAADGLAAVVDRTLRAGDPRSSAAARALVEFPPAPALGAGQGEGDAVDRPDASIVVPAYNEGHRLPYGLPKLVECARAAGHELVIVDDGSSDDTADLAEAALRDLPRGRLIRLGTNMGKGAAVRAGILAAQGEKIVYMDADLATSLDSLPAMLAALDDADVAVGSRAAPGAVVRDASMMRIVMGRCYNRLVRTFTDIRLRDTQCGFKGYRADAARQLYSLSSVDGFGFDVEVLALASRLQLRVVEVPVDWTAIEGTRVRPFADALKMTRDLVVTSREVRRTELPAPAGDGTEPGAEALPA